LSATEIEVERGDFGGGGEVDDWRGIYGQQKGPSRSDTLALYGSEARYCRMEELWRRTSGAVG
jgi:hypothetical protein